MKSMRDRFVTALLSALLVVSLVPILQAFAQESGPNAPLDFASEAAIEEVEDTTAEVDDASQDMIDDALSNAETNIEGDIAEVEAEGSAAPQVSYRTHVQTYGWQDWRTDGQESGTTGQSKRLEAINIQLDSLPYSGGIRYRTHVQTYGWQDWRENGQESGTTGQSKRLEAIQIELTGEMASHYDVWYRVHCQTFGWMGWAKNGERSGSATYAKRLESIEIRLLPKDSAAPGNTTRPYATRQITYRTHVQTYGWQGYVYDGTVSGTSGQSKRLEGINISLPDPSYSGGIRYRTHVQTYGWQDWRENGQESGTTGQSKRLEAIQVELTGEMASHYDVWYRVHCQTFGWMGWAKNGEQAGSAGLAKRLEAIQILLVAKESAAPTADFQGISQATTTAFVNGAVTASGPASRGPSSAGALCVRGSQLVDGNGNAIQLTGVSTHGLAWFPDYVNDACFKQLRTQWNANVVRLAMYTEEYGGYCSGGNQANLRALVKNGVQLATKNDLYVIVDWHILSDNNPLRHVEDAKAFFRDISSTFRDNTNVIYEICNEPNGGTSWNDIKNYANQVIPVIRENDPDAVIIVGTPTWSQEIDKAKASPLNYDNVMYALHFYATTHKDDLRNRMVSCVRSGLPVFVSEFGICDASGNGAIDESSANSWITTMKSLGVSWCMWSLCNKAESASILKSNCRATSDFKTGDLATSGTWLLKALNGTLPAGSDSSTAAPSNTAPASASAQPTTFTSGTFTCTATPSSSWAAGNGKTCYQYDLSITNKGSACSSWKVAVPFNKAVSLTNGWNGNYQADGSRLIITNASYNGSIAAGATVSGIGFQVTSDSGLLVKP